MKARRYCKLCGEAIPDDDIVKVMPRRDKMKYYHGACIERERLERGYTNNLRTTANRRKTT